jgi:hypothetical protein
MGGDLWLRMQILQLFANVWACVWTLSGVWTHNPLLSFPYKLGIWPLRQGWEAVPIGMYILGGQNGRGYI